MSVYICRKSVLEHTLVVLDSQSTSVECILLAAKSRIFRRRDVAGTAQSIGGVGAIGWGEWHSTFLRELWVKQDVGSGMKIAQRVTADKTTVTGERDITFEDTCTHSGTCDLRLDSLFRELQSAWKKSVMEKAYNLI